MSKLNGFFSYAHKDNEAEGGAITNLAHNLASQYELLTGDEIKLWLDREDIGWGDVWREEINSGLANTAFFIPILTPAYFNSESCKSEVSQILEINRNQETQKLILPILYTEVSDTIAAQSEPELIEQLLAIQHENWCETRLEESSSAVYRRSIVKMAKHLKMVNTIIDTATHPTTQSPRPAATSEGPSPSLITRDDVAQQPSSPEDIPELESENSGSLERLARMEVALPKLEHDLRSIETKTQEISDIATSTLTEGRALESANFAQRLRMANSLAERIEKPSEEFLDLTNEYMNNLREVDLGITLLLKDETFRGNKDDWGEIQRGIESLASSASALRQSEESIKIFATLGNLSRELKMPMRRIEQGLRKISSSVDTIESWEQWAKE